MGEDPARSVVFDRAADVYDETRELTAAARREVTSLLLAELRGRGTTLEVGVGTGLVALPLNGAGVPMVGIDLSEGMLGKLVEKAGGRAPFPLAVADATRLPFADGAFGAAIASHVLHLIDPWQRALAEMARVVRGGGLLLVNVGAPGRTGLDEVNRRFWSHTGAGRPARTLTDPLAVDEELLGRGLRVRLLPEVVEVRQRVVGEVIDRLEAGVFSGCWRLSEEVRRHAAARTREWARRRYGGLDTPQSVERGISWRAYDAAGDPATKGG